MKSLTSLLAYPCLATITAVAAALCLVLALFPAPAALAAAKWCEDEPSVTIVTPAGHVVTVHVTNFAEAADGVDRLAALQKAVITWQVWPVEHGRATEVELTVLIPDDASGKHFQTRSEVTMEVDASGRPVPPVLAQAHGVSGHAMHLHFKLDMG